ncbi:protease modulator HflC [Novosphingobium sp. YJ-S2-02]|uniref:Protease modulator HflC n=1 Tax=Novosphingobium aureum TaxID=2792964 RepID=A0A931MM99_9SPHN|nr:protease modulator HflC [Novosphingobium aureum]MBH0114234.1 protease modulator HflC [Novosphingobium aureum]
MDAFKQKYAGLLIALGVVVVALWMSVIIVPEDQQVVIVRGGKPNRVYNAYVPGAPYGATDAGVHFHIPGYERVMRIDKRLLSVDMSQEQVLSTDQQRVNVDAFARYRVTDPIKMIQTARTTENVTQQLMPILSSVVRQELGKRTFTSMLTAERGQAMANIRDLLDSEAQQYGARVVDVRIKRADLPDGAQASAFNRMIASRNEEAKTIQAQGQRDARIIRADAEATAAGIYARSYGKDPSFYDFYRAMQSYDVTFDKDADGSKTLLLAPDNAYLKHFRAP